MLGFFFPSQLDSIDEKTKTQVERYLNKTSQDVPIDLKPVEPHKFSILRKFSEPISHEAKNLLWIRVRGKLGMSNL
jgi:hypothetical protein